MLLKKVSRPAARFAVRIRRLKGRAARVTGSDRVTLAQNGALAGLLALIIFGSYWAGTGSGSSPASGSTATDATAAAQPSASADTASPAPATGGSVIEMASAGSVAVERQVTSENRPVRAPAAAISVTASPASAGAAQEPVKTAALEAPAVTPPAEIKPAVMPSFRDDRALKAETPAAVAPAVASAATATPTFRDARPLTAPSFKDPRPVASPSFRDDRPVVPASAPAAPASKEITESKPFEVGYFLDDRSPMARSLDDKPEPAEATVPDAEAAKLPAAATDPAPASPGGALPTLVALAPGQLRIDPTSCAAPAVATEALDGGAMRMRISANCHPNEFVQISYGGAEFIRKLNAYGVLDYTLDCFAGTASAVEVRFADGTAKSMPVVANDLDKVSKIAVVWRTGANLDLHVFEYAAKLDQPGHYWAKSPSSLGSARVQGQADGRGHGFLSSVDDDKNLGDKVEVYTFFHNDQQVSGSISLALDNETRGENPSGATCGSGALAEIDFQVSILPRQGQVTRQSGVLTRVDCGTRLTQDARFNQAAMPGLRIRR